VHSHESGIDDNCFGGNAADGRRKQRLFESSSRNRRLIESAAMGLPSIGVKIRTMLGALSLPIGRSSLKGRMRAVVVVVILEIEQLVFKI
jgi:hypothetical protein